MRSFHGIHNVVNCGDRMSRREGHRQLEISRREVHDTGGGDP